MIIYFLGNFWKTLGFLLIYHLAILAVALFGQKKCHFIE